jgi:CRP-like cAMP-binding protein
MGARSFERRLLTLAKTPKKAPGFVRPASLSSLRQNAILNALAEASALRVLEHGTIVNLALRQQVYESEQPIHDVYFPLDCVLSVVARMRDGSQIEIGTIGREGMSAFPLLMGASSTANVCYCQVRGGALKIPATLFHELTAADPAFRQLLDRYLQAYVNMLGQLAACNRLHSVNERCARWLLMTRDRVETNALPLTQEFLAMMLGTGRSGVAIAAATFRLPPATGYGLARIGHDVAAAAARAVLLAIEKRRVGGRYRVERVVAYDEAPFVEQIVAFRAIPLKDVDLTVHAFALDDQRERIGWKARRVRDAAGRVDDRALGEHRDFFFALGGAVVQPHLAAQHVHHLVGRVDVELAAIFAAARDESQRLGFLPQHVHAFAGPG